MLAIGCMFFVVGSTLEYAKHAEYIVAGITLVLGLLKTYVSLDLLTGIRLVVFT